MSGRDMETARRRAWIDAMAEGERIWRRVRLALLFLLLLLLAVALTGCADTVTFNQAATADPVGFWYGFWHGLIFPYAWIISLFYDGVAVYAIYNNGGWYDFGFFLGVGGISRTLSGHYH